MKTIKINESKTMVGMQIPRITGTLKSLFPIKRGKNENGDWSLQGGILSDDTGEMKITFSGCAELSQDMRGTAMVFRCHESKKGLTGVKIKEETYNGNTNPVLWITSSSRMFPADQEPSSEVPSFPPCSVEAKTLSLNKRQTLSEGPLSTSAQIVRERTVNPSLNDYLSKKVQLYELCLKSALSLKGAQAFTSEDVRTIATTLFIQATRDGMEKHLPETKPLESKKQESDMAEDDIQF